MVANYPDEEVRLAGLLRVRICIDREKLGRTAAAHIAESLRSKILSNSGISAIFASAPSQTQTLAVLSQAKDVAWQRVAAFHLDEYANTTADARHSFRRYLVQHLLSKIPIGRFEELCGETEDLQAECARYSALLEQNPPNIGLLGIGENGHLAFNDPPEARFDDPLRVRVVELAETCRIQQVHDGNFENLSEVPKAALTVTISEICRIPELFVMVPGKRKAPAVQAALEGPISEECPASILRKHPNAVLFLDRESASMLSARA